MLPICEQIVSTRSQHRGSHILTRTDWLNVVWPILMWLIPVTQGRADEHRNFRSTEVEFLRCAEDSRERSARFWSGKSLPGDWYSPCPMVWDQKDGAASGWTSFAFQQGEVSHWQMSLRGHRDEVLADVIPHEVDHTVRATLCRRPLPRWIDEGCASLFESETSHNRLRGLLANKTPRTLTVESIDQSSYPANSESMLQLYAEGFSLVEYLLTRGTPQDLLTIQKSNEPLSNALVRVYRTDLTSLFADWQRWENHRLQAGTACSCVDCPLHRPSTQQTSRPVLTIWTTSWCGPCQRFHSDLRNRPEFRKTLESRFQLILRDWDMNQPLAIRQRITTVPTFQTGAQQFSGYHGPEWLLKQLGIDNRIPRTADPAVAPSSGERASPSSTPSSVESVSPPPSPVRIAPLVIPVSTPAVQVLPSRTVSPSNAVPAENVSAGANLVPPLISIAVSVLTSLGVISGTAFTGGIGGVALMLIWKLIQRSATRSGQGKSAEGGAVVSTQAPFPRELDEAGELLGLRQSEGRVAALDALRGMFLDDELNKLHDSADPAVTAFVQKLRAAINQRVDEVAPLATKG